MFENEMSQNSEVISQTQVIILILWTIVDKKKNVSVQLYLCLNSLAYDSAMPDFYFKTKSCEGISGPNAQ